MEQKGKIVKRPSLSATVTLMIVLAVVLNSVFLVFISYRENRSIIMTQAGTTAMEAAKIIVSQIDADLFESAGISGVPDEHWYHVRSLLQGVKDTMNAMHVYALLAEYTDVTTYFADVASPWSDHIPFGLWDNLYAGYYAPQMFETIHTGLPMKSDIFYASGFGYTVGGFAPVLTNDGRVVGVVAIELYLDDALAPAGRFVMVMVIFAIASVVVFAVVSIFIVRNRVKGPMAGLKSLVSNVTHGNLAFKRHKKMYTDEMGQLTQDMYAMADVLDNIIQDLTNIDHEFNTLGDIDYRVDESKYENSFREVVEAVNRLQNATFNDRMALEAIFVELTQGNFDVAIDDRPGKKMRLRLSLRELTARLKEICETVTFFANSASEGQFDVSVNTSKFSGSWAELMNTLNGLMKAIEEPLCALENNVILMSRGDFSDLEGEFTGHFKVLKEACNLTNKITKAYIDEIAHILGRMAQGDLTAGANQDYIGDYEPIKTALNEILDSLNVTMEGIQVATGQVVLGAQLISKSSMQLAEGSHRQTTAVENLSHAVSSVHEKAMQTRTNATQAQESTQRSQDSAVAGEGIVMSMAENMNKIKESNESVSNIINVITSIAFQTNLLALNASVEAARAGEHGKGFSVVADEVRTLAGRSQQSASDTSGIISENTNSVEEGARAATDVVQAFAAISANINEINSLVSQITDVSSEQLKSIATINESVEEISKVVIDNSAMAQESASAAEELNSQADVLREKVEFFRLR